MFRFWFAGLLLYRARRTRTSGMLNDISVMVASTFLERLDLRSLFRHLTCFLFSQSIPKMAERLVISVDWGRRTHRVFRRVWKLSTTGYYGWSISKVRRSEGGGWSRYRCECFVEHNVETVPAGKGVFGARS